MKKEIVVPAGCVVASCVTCGAYLSFANHNALLNSQSGNPIGCVRKPWSREKNCTEAPDFIGCIYIESKPHMVCNKCHNKANEAREAIVSAGDLAFANALNLNREAQ